MSFLDADYRAGPLLRLTAKGETSRLVPFWVCCWSQTGAKSIQQIHT